MLVWNVIPGGSCMKLQLDFGGEPQVAGTDLAKTEDTPTPGRTSWPRGVAEGTGDGVRPVIRWGPDASPLLHWISVSGWTL